MIPVRLPSSISWATRYEHVFEADSRVLPFWDDCRFEDNMNSSFCREVVTEEMRDRLYGDV